jgi:hypothetical protein
MFSVGGRFHRGGKFGGGKTSSNFDGFGFAKTRSRGGRGRTWSADLVFRKRLPAYLNVHVGGMLQTGAAVSTRHISQILAEHIAGGVSAPSDHERRQRQRARAPAGFAVSPEPAELMPVELAQGRNWWRRTAAHDRELNARTADRGNSLPKCCPHPSAYAYSYAQETDQTHASGRADSRCARRVRANGRQAIGREHCAPFNASASPTQAGSAGRGGCRMEELDVRLKLGQSVISGASKACMAGAKIAAPERPSDARSAVLKELRRAIRQNVPSPSSSLTSFRCSMIEPKARPVGAVPNICQLANANVQTESSPTYK